MTSDTAGTPPCADAAKPILIGLCGWSRAGKDTIAQYLEREHSFHTTAFAEPLRAMLAESWQLFPEQLHGAAKDEPIATLQNRKPRDFMQSLGDWYLAAFGPRALIANVADIWRDLQDPKAEAPGLVVSDCRTTAEIEFVQESGGVIWWVGRPDTGSINQHRTEHVDSLQAALHRPGVDVDLQNTGTVHDLISQVENALAAARRREVAA
ncbi:MAG: hypothetical protein JNM76_14770 [Betaproteobacteria bacterium]|nr:hypothetical protein [Betaproteobacteria bacterium]